MLYLADWRSAVVGALLLILLPDTMDRPAEDHSVPVFEPAAHDDPFRTPSTASNSGSLSSSSSEAGSVPVSLPAHSQAKGKQPTFPPGSELPSSSSSSSSFHSRPQLPRSTSLLQGLAPGSRYIVRRSSARPSPAASSAASFIKSRAHSLAEPEPISETASEHAPEPGVSQQVFVRPAAAADSDTIEEEQPRARPHRHFVSRRLPLGYEAEKPWLTNRTHAEKMPQYLIWAASALGLVIVAVLSWFGTTEVENFNYCTVLSEDFSNGLDSSVWFHELQVGGFGNNQFEWTTNSSDNAFVKDNQLHIVPTLTADYIGEKNMLNGYTVNLTTDGTCTSHTLSDCAVRSNASTDDMIPPIRSARLTTKFSANVKYGKVEIRARLPAGDWLWPALWMLPTDNVYGDWPSSGEIDIVESRGNDHTYADGGNNVMTSTLHWGPTSDTDMYYKTTGRTKLKRTTFADSFHTFGLEWNEKYISTYLDGRLRQVMYHKFKTPFWELGNFDTTYDNGTSLADPWPVTSANAPFDQDFYLILNVAVGGTNGFFQDGVGNKPWINDDRQTAMRAFWDAKDSWWPSWGDEESRALVVDHVKIYKMCDA
ncbi:concanavalin A-like lectin/glucanase domain-containing protein [Myxozyma melibiosi]|uniref:Concanavalin A-like lectin/glucanase domain-containing protein n=1 Tax=Myxozyma melibiosi TaxID=54550 RepID=A0ABR1F064_9ASCO